MQKIFRIWMLLLTAALVACGGGGGSSGSNPTKQQLVTTAGGEVILPVGTARNYQISGGVPPYRVVNTDQAIAIGQVSGNTLTIGTLSAGSTKIDILDNSGASISIGVKVGSSIPLYTTAPGSLTIGVGASVARTFWIGGGGAPYTVEGADSNVAVVQMLNDTQWRVTGVAKGSTTIKIRDGAGVEISIGLEVGSPELRISPTELTIPVGLEAVAKISGGQPPYRVAGGIPAAITATIAGDELRILGSLASALDVSVIDAAGQTVKVKVEINTSTTAIRLSPSAVAISENDSQNIQFSIFGAVGATCVFTSDPSFLQPTTPGCLNRSSVTLQTGTRGSRCVNGDKVVTLTVVDANRSVGTAEVAIVDNGSCGNLVVLPATARVRTGATMQLALEGGSGSYVVSSDNPSVATATASGSVVVVTGGKLTGDAVITVRDQSDTSKVVTLPVKVFADETPSVPALTLSPQTLELGLGASADVLIGGGSGNVDVAVSNSQIATATLNGKVLRVTAGSILGTAKVTIRDQADPSRSATLTVTVVNAAGVGITASPNVVPLSFSAAADVLLSGGSGKYDIAVANTAIATATLAGNTMRITAGSTAGKTTITVRDQANTSKTVLINITVSGNAVGVLDASPKVLFIQTGSSADVLLSGGSGKFDVAVANTGIANVVLTGNTMRVTAGSMAGATTVTVRDQADQGKTVSISVTVTSGAVGALVASPSTLGIQSGATADVLLSGGSGKYDFAVSNSAVANAVLAGNKLTVTAGTTTGSATVTVRDQADATRSVVISVTVTTGPAPVKPMTASPSAATGSVQETLQFLLQGGTGPYSVVVSNPSVASVTLPVVGNLVNVLLLQAGQATLVVTDANGQTLNIGVTSNQAQQASLRFAPSAFEIGEDSLQPVALTVFGGTPPYRAVTSDLTLSGVAVNGNEFTVGLGTRGNRCINPVDTSGTYIPSGAYPVTLTVIDSGGAFATSVMTIRDNGSGLNGPCAGATAFTTTAGAATSLLLGSSRTFSISGGSAPYTVASSNPAVATVALSSQAGFSITGLSAGTATVTLRDAASGTLTVVVTVNP